MLAALNTPPVMVFEARFPLVATTAALTSFRKSWAEENATSLVSISATLMLSVTRSMSPPSRSSLNDGYRALATVSPFGHDKNPQHQRGEGVRRGGQLV